MALHFIVDESCPECREPVKLAVVELHPKLRETAVHTLQCSFCGFEKKRPFRSKQSFQVPPVRRPQRRGISAFH